MSFKSVNNILIVLQQQAQWQEPPFQRLLQCWPEVVGVVVAFHTRPLSIQRDVLRVATSSAAWAQNMTFARQKLLQKLNPLLPSPLLDIRFSTAGWQRSPQEEKLPSRLLPSEHPSYMGDASTPVNDVPPATNDLKTAFEHWAKTIQARSHGLPLCPECDCPTPAGELQRWGVCGFCAAKKL